MTAVVDDLFRAAQELGVLPVELQGQEDVRDQVRVHAGLGEVPVRAEQWRTVRARVEDLVAEIVRRSNHGGQCRLCSAPIVWGETETGNRMPLDPLARPGGNVIRMPQGKRQVLRVLPPAALPVVGRPAYQSHHASCPYADQLRRPRARRERRADSEGRVALCARCGSPMDPWLPENGYSAHPCCDPYDEGSEG